MKRFFDLFCSTVLLILLIPIFLFVALIIKIDGGPILFKQERVGENKRNFTIYKFRTMKVNAPKNVATHLLDNPDKYLIRYGGFLRKYCLDELPQLINIIKGEMSFVGPRPALYNQYDLIKLRDKYNANHVKPGLTGLAQTSGRDEIELEKKAQIDGEYVKKQSFIFDMIIIFRTFFKVLSSDGAKKE